jgi:uncharacterized protein YacL
MNSSTTFLRIVLSLLSILLCTTYVRLFLETSSLATTLLLGLSGGLAITLICIGLENLCRTHHLNKLLVALLGIALGTAVAASIIGVITLTFTDIPDATLIPIKAFIALFSIVLSFLFIQRSSEEFAVSIPYIRFKPLSEKSKEIIIDGTILQDSRLIDLSNSGILDRRLILPRFVLKDLQTQLESPDEAVRFRAKKCIETAKRLESNADLQLTIVDTDFPETQDQQAKLIRLAKYLGANIFTADINRVQQAQYDGLRVINIHSLSNALKPLTQNGELISIKIQRYGKEPLQGVGYLDDGTMVVVNGASKDLDKTIRAQVLSVKHTSSGRMIFCNALEEESLERETSLV